LKLCDVMSAQKQIRINSTYFFLYTLLLTAHIGLVWVLPYFPTQDGPSHLYNLVILDDLLHGGKEWGRFFTYKLHAVPNLGFHLIAYPLLQLFSPLFTEKIFVSIYIFLMAACVPFFLRSFDKMAFPLSFLVFPVIFNFNIMMGFYSYVIAVPVFLFAISLAWRIRNRSHIMRFICYNAAGAIVFYLHLIPFMFYLITLSIFAIVKHENLGDAVRSLAKQLLEIIPLLALLIYYFSTGSSSPVPADFSYLLSGQRAVTLLTDLFTFSTVYFSPWQLVPGSICLFVLLLLLRAFVKDRLNGKHQLYAEQKAMLLLALTLTAIYLAAPFGLGDGSYFNNRFPWVILLLILPPLAGVSEHNNPAVKVGILTTAILFLFFNTVIFRQQGKEVATFLEGLRVACSKGDMIMLYKTDRPAWPKIDVILHATSYYGIFNGCVDVGNYEAEFNLFPVHFNKNLAALSLHSRIERNPDSINFSQYPALMEVLGWKLKPEARKQVRNFFDMRFENSKLSLWHRR
jgi:hypothetical protein